MHHDLITIIGLFAAALVVGVVADRLRIPYIVALLVAALPFSSHASDREFADSFILLLLPPLIFEAALNFEVAVVRRTWRAIAFMAVPAVLLTVAIVGGGLTLLGLMPIVPALLLGAIVAPTDPIAVIATFKRYTVPPELASTVEGESLFNDGVSVVLYGALAIAASTGAALQPLALAGTAVGTSLGGALFGVIAAAAAYAFVRRAADANLHVVATVVVAYGSYLGAEAAHVSGIFAALLAGIAYRWFGRDRTEERVYAAIDGFWSVAAFFANSIVFLVVGLQIEFPRIVHAPRLVLATLLLVVVARLIAVYGGLPFLGLGRARRAWRHVVALAGIRGGISIALAVALPAQTAFRAELIDAVYGVVAITILVQGVALGPIVKRLSL